MAINIDKDKDLLNLDNFFSQELEKQKKTTNIQENKKILQNYSEEKSNVINKNKKINQSLN